MKIQIIQHSKGTPAGTTLSWLSQMQIPYQLSRIDLGESLLPVEQIEGLIICGGGMNVDQEDRHPWLKDEKQYIKKAIELDKKILGLCLGGQLIAEALGAKVGPHPEWEVGWHEVSILPQNIKIMAFQWHGYSFGLPEHAEWFATNSICKYQGFSLGKKIVGLQFHPESTVEWIKECAETSASEYPTGPHVQSPTQIMENAKHQPGLQNWYFKLLNTLYGG